MLGSQSAINYSDAVMSAMVCQITGVSIVYSTVCSGAYQRKHQSSASLEGNFPVTKNSLHKRPVTWISTFWSQVGWIRTHHRDGLLSFLDSPVGLWVGIQYAGDLVSQTSKVRILHSAEEDRLSPFDSKSLPYVRAPSKSNNKYYVYRQSQG